MIRPTVRLFVFMAASTALLSHGCSRVAKDSPAAQSQPAATQQAAETREIRVVSLSPAITRTLVDFRLQSKVVGRSPHCYSVDKTIPVVGDLTNVNYEQLVRLNPTHILVQPPAAGVDPALERTAREHGWSLAAWRLNSLDDIEKMIREIPAAVFPANSTELDESTRRAAELAIAIAQSISPQGRQLWRGRVLMVSSYNPVLAFGTGTYLSDMLAAFGSTNAVEAAGWVQLSLEDVARINPEAIIFVIPGFSDNKDTSFLTSEFWNTETIASNDRRVAVIGNWDSFLPSSAITASADELREALSKFAEQASPSP